jgi:hypothetical protein
MSRRKEQSRRPTHPGPRRSGRSLWRPFAEVTIPAGSAIGGGLLGGYGAIKGGQLGYALGQAACRTVTGGGGGGRASGSSARMTRPPTKTNSQILRHERSQRPGLARSTRV